MLQAILAKQGHSGAMPLRARPHAMAFLGIIQCFGKNERKNEFVMGKKKRSIAILGKTDTR
jgi:hypothetical protein